MDIDEGEVDLSRSSAVHAAGVHTAPGLLPALISCCEQGRHLNNWFCVVQKSAAKARWIT